MKYRVVMLVDAPVHELEEDVDKLVDAIKTGTVEVLDLHIEEEVGDEP